MGDHQARICESRGVRIPPATRQTVVVSDVEKASKRRQVGNRKTNASEPLQKCRYRIKRHQNRELSFGARDKSGGNPFTGQAVSGTKVA